MSTLSAMYFVYGIYVLLFGTYMSMVTKHQQDDKYHNNRLYASLTITLFVLSTALVAIYTRFGIVGSVIRFDAIQTRDFGLLVNRLTRGTRRVVYLAFADLLAVLLNGLYAVRLAINTPDITLIPFHLQTHRCYVIWGFSKRVAIPLIVGSILINALGIAEMTLMTIDARTSSSSYMLYKIGNLSGFAYDISIAAFNFVLTLLTAGRIWWIHRQAYPHDIHHGAFLHSVLRIILESGMIYPISSALGLILANTRTLTNYISLAPVIALSAGIAPTLIMVRAKLGKTVESMQDQVSTIRFTSRPAPQEGTQMQIHSIGNPSVAEMEVESVKKQ
ncbi:hypothetical protein WG66_001919 [Moniliophthora roreri]|nr:hypothetical protein WG66_001919 [Moniliophthora roreri]